MSVYVALRRPLPEGVVTWFVTGPRSQVGQLHPRTVLGADRQRIAGSYTQAGLSRHRPTLEELLEQLRYDVLRLAAHHREAGVQRRAGCIRSRSGPTRPTRMTASSPCW